MTNAEAIITGAALTVLGGAFVTLVLSFQVKITRRVEQVHVLVNGNLTDAVTALGEARAENVRLRAENATLRSEATTADREATP